LFDQLWYFLYIKADFSLISAVGAVDLCVICTI